VKYKAYFYFSTDSPIEVTRAWILAHNGLKYALWRKEVAFWGPSNILEVKFPKNRQKWPSVGTLSRNEGLQD